MRRGDDMTGSFSGILKVILGTFDVEGSKKSVEFLVNSLSALGVEKVWLKVPPFSVEEVDVLGPLRFKLFGALAAGKPVEVSIVADEPTIQYLEEELGSGLKGAILTLETATGV